MQIAKSAALLAATAGTVMLGTDGALARDGHDGDDRGTQVNRCNSFSLTDVVGGPTASCLNFERIFGNGGGGTQVNECNAFAAASVVGNLIFYPIGDIDGPSAGCANIRA